MYRLQTSNCTTAIMAGKKHMMLNITALRSFGDFGEATGRETKVGRYNPSSVNEIIVVYIFTIQYF